MKFSEMIVESKIGIKLERLTGGSAWQYSLSPYLQITYWKTLLDTTINQLNGAGNLQRIA